MKRSRFTEEQVIGILREHEAGGKTADLCRKHGVSSATFYKWKATYGGMDVSQARKLKVLEDENARLKRLLRDECLNETLFASLSHARSVLSGWRDDYNHVRPHSGIGGLTPADAARRVAQPHPQGHDDNPGLQL